MILLSMVASIGEFHGGKIASSRLGRCDDGHGKAGFFVRHVPVAGGPPASSPAPARSPSGVFWLPGGEDHGPADPGALSARLRGNRRENGGQSSASR